MAEKPKHSGPLAGIRVVDLTSMVFGPYATQIMADMGADVIKVEPPGGDDTRNISRGPVPGMSGVFVNVNRGKRSIVIDMKSKTGKDALIKLIAGADVFIHSMRAKAIVRLGFDYARVAAIKPDIIYTNCYGYSRHGPDADKPAYDDTIQAECGVEANACKYLAAEAGFEACHTAMLSMGGMGYAKEYHVERYLREILIPRTAPVSPHMILNFLAEKVLGLPKSY